MPLAFNRQKRLRFAIFYNIIIEQPILIDIMLRKISKSFKTIIKASLIPDRFIDNAYIKKIKLSKSIDK